MTKRWTRALGALAVLAVTATLLPATLATSAPTASDAAAYQACGRVFPDPQAFWPSPAASPGQSPWAKGNTSCRATDFLGWQETLDGLDFLASEEMFGDFVEVYNLGEDDGLDHTIEGEFADVLDEAAGEGMTAGLPIEDLGREKVPVYMVRVTDEQDTGIPIGEREHFAYTLSIHGIERAGIEGGIRAIEDLATWASCEKHGDEGSAANCEQEQAGPDTPHPILETIPEDSLTAGAALKRSSTWFVLSNPDGWRRGDKQDGGFFYQRYNGNGVDMNRDWPAIGFTFRPYTPWSEPETRAVGKALKSIKPKWTGGLDLHGQLVDRAFSFTLLGGSERPYNKDRRIVQYVKGAWEDAETRLAWSPAIKPNDAPPQPEDPRVYGVQWGTIWDTIDYTVTGDVGSWMDSPLGLDADGVDNEMSLSHVGNCGVGTCYLTEAEQLHVDGNKSLIYAMIHYALVPEDTRFDYQGDAAYLFNPARITNAGSPQSTAPEYTDLPQQEGFQETITHVSPESVLEFEVQGPDDGVYNGGLRATVTWSNVTGVGAGSNNEIAIDRRRGEEDPDRGDEDDPEWQTVNSYFNQDSLYQQGGAQLDVNLPTPGQYRIRITGVDATVPSEYQVDVQFLAEQAWPDPGQLPYDVSNMDFFTMLRDHVESDDKLVPAPIDDVRSGAFDLTGFDTVVAADEAILPGYEVERAGTETQEPVEGTVIVPAPGAGDRSEATSGYLEFDVSQPQLSLIAEASSFTTVDMDLYLQRQLEDGSWSADLASGASADPLSETLTLGRPAPGRYRLEVHNWAGGPGPANVTITFEGLEAVVNESPFTDADRDAMAARLRAFVEQGGNLVLTDNSVRALEWMGLTPEGSVAESTVYAGHVGFTADNGATDTYADPLAANIDQPGAAEGAGHRHQMSEPVPIGFSIQDEEGADAGSMPQWVVDTTAFKDAGGRVVGVSGSGVTFGEVPLGDGNVRIIGSLLTMPTEEYDHPFGLGSYGVTYSGYEAFRNLLDWVNPNRSLPPTQAACANQVPQSGFGDIGGNTHRDNIECVAWYEIALGTSPEAYSPDNPATRAQMASFIARLAVESGLELPADAPDAFDDDNDSVHEDNINALAAMGLVLGKGDRVYDPNGSVTRAQMASFIARLHERVTGPPGEAPGDAFGDDAGSVHEANINLLAALEVVLGRPDTNDVDGDGDTTEILYFPDEAVSRAQMASFLVRVLGLHVTAGSAHFGGGQVALASTDVEPEGDVGGLATSNKEIDSLVANGCGVEGESVEVAPDGSFSFPLGVTEGQCTLVLRLTTTRPEGVGTGQSANHRFTITVVA